MDTKNTYYPFYTGETSWNTVGNNSDISDMNFSLGDIKQGNYNNSLGSNINLNNSLDTGIFADNSQFTSNLGFNLNNNNSGSSLLSSLGSSLLKSAFTSKDPKTGAVNQGWAGTVTDLLKSGLGFYIGSKQLDQAEDTLAENKRQFNLNYDAQKSLINDELAWQYQARKDRNAANAGTLTQI